MKLITTSIIILALAMGLTGCSAENIENNETSKKVVYKIQKETKILTTGVNLKEPNKIGENYSYFLSELVKGGLSVGTKNTYNIDLKKGQHLKIQTVTKYPITVMLKDNYTGDYVYNNTSIPKDNLIIIDPVVKEGQYELMVDFNEIKMFKFQVYIVN